MQVYGLDSGGSQIWSQLVDLSGTLDWANWVTVTVERDNIATLRFFAPGYRLWPSVDDMVLRL